MKKILLINIVIIWAINLNAQQNVTFKDPRDGKIYKTVKIGNQIWMAENLSYRTTAGNYWVYDDHQSNLNIYGYLYDWETAMKVCPTGWSLPDLEDWKELLSYIGESVTKLKSKSGWVINGNGSDIYGFNALPGGGRNNNGEFVGIGNRASWWCSSLFSFAGSDELSLSPSIYYKDNGMFVNPRYKYSGFSVRCIKK